MCDLCSSDKEAVRSGLEMRAEELERMAALMRSMASGRIKPHTSDAAIIRSHAHALLRFLANGDSHAWRAESPMNPQRWCLTLCCGHV